jgi:hypothetical protein
MYHLQTWRSVGIKYHITIAFNCQLLQVHRIVEQHLGQIDIWRKYIIRYLVIDVLKTSIVRKLTAFFYGNDIPVYIASQLYNACNDKYNIQVTEYVCDLYSHWQRCRYKIHMSEYCNVRLRKFI